MIGVSNGVPTRAELLAKFHDMKRRGVPIVGGGAGTNGGAAEYAER